MEFLKDTFKATPAEYIMGNVELADLILPCTTCLLTVTIFNILDIRPFPYEPIMLRHCLTSQTDFTSSLNAKSVKHSNHLGTSNITLFDQSHKFKSKYLDTTGSLLCFKLNLLKFVLNTKSWNYFQHIYLFPVVTKKSNIIFWNDTDDERYLITIGISMLIYDSNILSFDIKTYHKDCEFYGAIEMLMDLKFSRTVKSYSYNILPVCDSTQYMAIKIELPVKLQKILGIIDAAFSNARNISFLRRKNYFNLKLNCKRINGNILWSRKLKKLAVEHVLSCLSISVVWKYIAGMKFGPTNDQRIPRVQILSFSGYELDSIHMSLQYLPEQIHFVACGNTVDSIHLLYQVMLQSYDSYSWIAIILVFSVITPFTWSFLRESKKPFRFITTIMAGIYKNLVEQSDPYLPHLLKPSSLKLLSGGVLLCAVVLSNAYKNENIYKLISPTKFKPLELFKELVRDNYTILSEPAYVKAEQHCLQTDISMERCLKSIDVVGHELLATSIYATSMFDEYFNTDYYFSFKIPKHVWYVYNMSSLWLLPVEEVLRTIFITNKTLLFSTVYHFFDSRELSSINYLRMCNNSAFLVEQPRLFEIKYILETMGLRKISIGKKVLVERRIGYHFSGLIHSFIQKRIKGIQSSGIPDWWNKFLAVHTAQIRINSRQLFKTKKGLTKVLNYTSQSSQILKSKRLENVNGILILLAFGCQVAFVCWLSEISKVVFIRIKQKLYCIYRCIILYP